MEHQAGNIAKNDSNLDIRRILFLILKYWYWVTLSVGLALFLAYMVNRYTVRIYTVSTTILIKDQNERDNSISELLYNGRGFMSGKNYYNEEILLRSYPLIRRSISKLDFTTSFFKEGDVKTSELYPGPLNIVVDTTKSPLPHGKSFYITLSGNDNFILESSKEIEQSQTGAFDKWIDFEGSRYKISRRNNSKELDSDRLLVKFRSVASVASSYTGRVGVNWLREQASILSLSLNGPTPSKDAVFLRSLTETYRARDLLLKNEQATRTINFIDDQLATISDSLVNIELQIQKFKESNFSSGISSEEGRYQENLDRLVEKKSELILQENYFNYLTDYINNEAVTRDITIPAAIGVSNSLLNELVKNLIDLQVESKQLLKSTNPDNPYLLQIKNRISETKMGIREVLSSLNQSLKIAKIEVEKQINTIRVGLRGLPSAQREYVNLNRLYKLSESLFLILMEKKAEASITQASTTSDVVIVNPPSIGAPITPKTSRNYTIALLLGLSIPISLILLFDHFNDKIKFKEDLEKYTDIPFLGVIGHNKQNENLIVHNSPRSAITESFRSIRSNINFFIGNKTSKTILITSSIAGEGKTFCSENLAMIFGSTGKKAVLIGADMRRPKLFRDFELSNDKGLSDYLSGDLQIDDVIQKTPFDNLHILNSGTIPPNPSELLLRDKLSEMMTKLKENFDFIIIDSPPVGLVTDAMIMAKYADHSIYIVRQGYTPVGTVKNADEMYKAGKISNVSILFNDVTVNKYGYGYGYSYKYGYTYGYGAGSGYYAEDSRSKSILDLFNRNKRG